MPDIQLNGESITTSGTAGTTAPAAGTSETWSVAALDAGIPALRLNQTYALVDASSTATLSQQLEIIRVTACDGSGDTSITVTRGADGTTPVAHASATTFNIVVVSSDYNTRTSGAPPYAPERLNAKYDIARGFYNGKAANTRIMDQGRADSMVAGMSRHVVIGDSVSAGATSGVGVTTYDRLHAWPMMMRDQLAVMGIPANGTGFVRINDAGQFDARWVAVAPTGTWSATSNIYSMASTVSATSTFVADRSGSHLDVGYVDFGGATVSVAVDGTAVGSFSTTAGSGTAAKRKRFANVGVRIGSQIKLTVTTIGTGFKLTGISVFTPNAGIIVDNIAQSGSGAAASGAGATSGFGVWSDLTAGTGGPLPYFKDLYRKRQVTDASSTAASNLLNSATANFTDEDIGEPIDQFPTSSGIMFPPNTYILSRNSSTQVVMSNNALQTLSGMTINISRDPHCIHICLGGNDTMSGVVTQTQVRAALTTIRNQFPNSDVILHLENEPTPTLATAQEELDQQQSMYQLADDLDLPLYDWRDRAGNYATAFGNGVMQDYQAHMIPGMYADLGSSIGQWMGGGSGHPQSWSPAVYDPDLVPKYQLDQLIAKTNLSGTAASSGTTDTKVLSHKVQFNSVAVGDAFEAFLNGISSSTGTLIFKIHVGAAGTTADTVAWTSITSAAQVANQRAGITSALIAVRSIGATGTVQVEGLAYAHTALLPTVVAAVGTVTVDTTKDWFITLSVTCSSGTFTAQSATVRKD